ncbi:4-hydroxy-tetrahydrodipicolinate synthase [Pseudoalteromonas aurantia]|uniref:4-hydroxy-tetrahydrodipicolinate synthase n=1 Tax=Pseudoalteromonas aurantia TaxID=43654 RepID=A0A5S3V7Y9_9GAMM|nr:4-hydroxy-tetrahydrodipicolinate synthase [Pseudoalteromonas aurantia]TMO66977.1 4-hydroxy-tetrahydrodipicolinate synthase [Pseudoalteromonas aurantia]TMO67344.1 4-hydroxy-tetrahydrodipicolinate synthase [Pseudoalteromonas aurantia]TMO74756.1 4-hydroxy-tetrahydrodipicolinate synthase [Pseudoalteromonas aurantia]
MKSQYDLSNYPLWTALVTPFDANNQVDYNILRTLVCEQAQANNGILLLGSTGEGLALTTEEHQHIVRYVCDLNLDVPLMVAVGGANLQEQIAWVEFCNTLPIHAFLLGSPLYAKPGIVGQAHWFDALLSASDLPCMLYNVPGRSAVAIDPQVLQNLTHHTNLWALKEASGDIAVFEAFRKAAPQLAIYSGDDGLMPYFAQAGATGLVSVAANAWPQQTAEFVRRSMAGTFPNLFTTWTDAVDSLFTVANPIPVKVLMHAQGKLNTPNLRPPLTHLELPCTQAINSANTTILSWN